MNRGPFTAASVLRQVSGGLPGRVVSYASGATIYTQGETGTSLMFIEHGFVKLSVVSPAGKEAILTLLSDGEFFGEGCLIGEGTRLSTAVAMCDTTLREMEAVETKQRLTEDPEFASAFLAHLLARNLRIEEDLVDQLFNSTEQRLARALLMLARYRSTDAGAVLPKISQQLLAELIGSTRTRVNFFMNKFRRQGMISYDHGLIVHPRLQEILTRDTLEPEPPDADAPADPHDDAPGKD